MNVMQKLINKKVNNITIPELFKYCRQHDISITNQQATEVVAIIRQKTVNIYQEKERKELLDKIAFISSLETAKKVELLLEKLVRK